MPERVRLIRRTPEGYPYSILDTHRAIAPLCSSVRFFSTLASGPNLYGAPHIAMLGIKR